MFNTYIRYDSETGKLYWQSIDYRYNKVNDKEVGHITTRGYRNFEFKSSYYQTHRVIWFLEKGYWPTILDHIDGNKLNNKIENLREVTKRENDQNKQRHREGHLPGTSYYKNNNLWRTRINVNKKSIHLGYFKTELEAHEVYINYIKENLYGT